METIVKAQPEKEPYRKLIIALSIILPLAVAILFKVRITGYDFSFLPPIYATINGLTALFLIAAVIAIKNGQRKIHENLIKICMGLSATFLLMYVAYHMTSESTSFGGEGVIRYIYFFILLTHILLSVVIIPLVLFTFSRGISRNYAGHRRLAKYAFPLWLYVAITGVIVYIMISPYYA
jgi:putative membrane protein